MKRITLAVGVVLAVVVLPPHRVAAADEWTEVAHKRSGYVSDARRSGP